MTVADDRVADFAGEIDQPAREYATACLQAAAQMPAPVGDAERLLHATRAIMLLVLKLSSGDRPGEAADEDVAWAVAAAFARREVLVQREARFDGAATARNLALIERVCALIGDWPEPDWSNAVAESVRRMADARRSGKARGQALRMARESERERESQSTATHAGWLLRHPADHYFLRALSVVSDAELSACLNEWIAALDPSYAALAAQDWSSERSQAGLLIEARVIDPPRSKWTEPIRVMVLATGRGDAPPSSVVALRQVKDPHAPFNGTLYSMLADEQWLICGNRLDDNSVLVGEGTRRIRRAG